jgi:hypothetical protein
MRATVLGSTSWVDPPPVAEPVGAHITHLIEQEKLPRNTAGLAAVPPMVKMNWSLANC